MTNNKIKNMNNDKFEARSLHCLLEHHASLRLLVELLLLVRDVGGEYLPLLSL